MEPLDLATDESVRHAVGESVLAIESAVARVERALTEVPAESESCADARRALERAKADLDHVRRRLQQDMYFPNPQGNLF
ncbi:MAG: hypothetical protein M1522_02140 [Actinobacteria bacterium]|nr:hypothetical protein [Actinomycetota bacterium]